MTGKMTKGVGRTGFGRAQGLKFVPAMALILLPAFAGCGVAMPPGGNDNGDGTADCPTGAAIGETTVSYANDIVPIFAARGCLSTGCHGGGLVAFGYDLRTYEGIFGPGENGRSIGVCDVVPGDPEASYIIEKLTSDQPRTGQRMPMNRSPLPDDEIELIRTWILEGAADN